MIRLIVVGLLAVCVAGTAIVSARIDTDVRAMFGAHAPAVQLLDRAEGRAMTIVLRHADAGRAEELARGLADVLARDPMVAEMIAPVGNLAALTDFLWQYRYALAPPGPGAWEAAAMSGELADARAALTGLGTGALAGRYLMDPSGSFRRLVEHLGTADRAPPLNDPTAAAISLQLAEAPFDVSAQAGFDARIHGWAADRDATALILAPRSISARISQHIATRSVRVAAIGSALLLGWLAWAFRSARAVAMTLLPLAVGFGAAVLIVNAVFGTVHVLALGFGGALLGLALDYPIHLISHRGHARSHATRCVRLGAATTAIAFGALVTAGPPALAQVGVFVGAGLLVSAAVALWLGDAMPEVPAPPFAALRGFCLPGRTWAFGGILVVCIGGLVLLPERQAQTLAPPPQDVLDDLAELRRIMDLPSGRYTVEVTGSTLPEVLAAQTRLRPVLDGLTDAGDLGRTAMLSDRLPARPADIAMPDAEALSERLPDALALAGLDPAFRTQIVAAHVAGMRSAQGLPASFPAATASLVHLDDAALTAPVRLWDVSDPTGLEAAITALGDPQVRFVDRQAWVMEGIATIRRDTLRALGLGCLGAVIVLAWATRRNAPAIILGTAAATALAGLCAGAMFGGIGVFLIMALVLVMGIGIDYGLLAAPDREDGVAGRALGSILLCAGSTVLAFGAMALSGVSVLTEIGTAVVFGVLAMVAMALWRAEGHR